MKINVSRSDRRWDWQMALFLAICVIGAVLFGTGLRFLAAPWSIDIVRSAYTSTPVQDIEMHRWHTALFGVATGIMEAGVFLSLLRKPRQKALLVQFLAIDAVIALAITVPLIGPFMFIIGAPVILAVLVYPERRDLIRLSVNRSVNRWLVILAALLTLLFLPMAIRDILWQVQGMGGDHALAQDWASDADHLFVILIAAWVSVAGRPGWKTLSGLTGVALLYLSLAGLLMPGQPGGWGVAGAILTLLLGAGFLLATFQKMESQGIETVPATSSKNDLIRQKLIPSRNNPWAIFRSPEITARPPGR